MTTTGRPKRIISDFALFGGTPRFSHALHVGRPALEDRALLWRRLGQSLDSGWLTNNGPMVQAFEVRLAAQLGVKHVITTVNGTTALDILLRALDVQGEVIVPSFTFVATVHTITWQRATPVFCDIDPDTHNLDPVCVERLVSERTSAILGVHLWGRPCAVAELESISERYGIPLLFDAAHAFNSSFAGRKIGSFGRAEVFSFHATKFIHALEGGAIATNDDELARRLRLMINFGFHDADDVRALGMNGKMHEFSAAVGLTSLDGLDATLSWNQKVYRVYRDGLAGIAGIKLLEYDDHQDPNFQYVVLEVDETAFGVSRDRLLAVLCAENVLARRYFYPCCHNMEPYRTTMPEASASLPNSKAISDRVLVLPAGRAVTLSEAEAVAELIELSGRYLTEHRLASASGSIA